MTSDAFAQLKELAEGAMPGNFAGIRSAAMEAVKKKGLPGMHLEGWKYTDGSAFVTETSKVGSADSSAQVQLIVDACVPEGLDCFKLVFLNGIFLKESSCAAVSSKFEIEVSEGLSDGAIEKLSKNPSLDENVFANLNLALGELGVSIKVNEGVVLDKPFLIVSCVSDNAESAMIFPRLTIELAKGSKADFVEVVRSNSEIPYSCFTVVDSTVADNAQFSYVQVNQHSQKAHVFNAISSVQGRDSISRTGVFNFGGLLTRNELFSVMDGENSRSEMLGLNVLEQSQKVDNHTVLDHAVPHCESYEMVKGVYGDKSTGVFDGTIIVRPDAQKTNAIQSNQSILLSDKATSNAKPQLKIWADDVKCTHGATVGQLDDDAMFYLRSRGIKESDARAMLVHAFASEVVSSLDHDFLKELLENLLTEKLERI